MGMAKVWAGGGSHRDPGETGSWMHAFKNMISDSSHKSFGVSALREQRYNGDREPSITPFLRSPQVGTGPVGLRARKGEADGLEGRQTVLGVAPSWSSFVLCPG